MQLLKRHMFGQSYLASRAVPRAKALSCRVSAVVNRVALLTAQILRSKTPAGRVLTACLRYPSER